MDSNEAFDALKSLMDMAHWEASNRQALLSLITSFAATNPTIYESQWLPFMGEYAHHWRVSFQSICYDLKHFHALCALLPCARFELSLIYKTLPLSALNPEQLIALDLDACTLNLSPMTDEVMSHHLFTYLRSISISFGEMNDHQILILSRLIQKAPLKTMSLNHLAFGVEGLKHLITSGSMAQLDVLELAFMVQLGVEGVRELITVPRFKQLKQLNLGGCGVGTQGVALLVDVAFDQLNSLKLFDNNLNDEAIMLLTQMPGLQNVTELLLHDNEISEVGIQALANCPYLGAVRRLTFGQSQAPKSRSSRRALANSPYLHESIRQKYKT